MARLRLSLLLCVCVAPPALAGVDYVDFEAGLSQDDNVGRAQKSRDARDDLAAEISATTGKSSELRPGTAISLEGAVRGRKQRELDDLDETAAALSLRIRQKFGLGAYAPSLGLTLDAERIESASDIRDSWLYGARLGAGKRIDDRWSLAAGIGYEWRDGDEDRQQGLPPALPGGLARGDVFDLGNRELRASVDYALNATALLSFAVAWRDGDIVSSARPYPQMGATAQAKTRDEAFGDAYNAYRIDGETLSLGCGLNIAISDAMSVEGSVEYQDTDASNGISYDKTIFRIRLLYSR